jgi:hypothetical protein
MSDAKDKRLNMSFEDDMKNAVTPQLNKEIMIEEKGKKYSITDAKGKKVKFTKITFKDAVASKFVLKVFVNSYGAGFYHSISLRVDQHQMKRDYAMINIVPDDISNDGTIEVSVESTDNYKNEDFETCNLSYELL